MNIFNKIYTSSFYIESNRLWQKITSKKIYRIAFGIVTGAGVGLLYWNFIGCTGGTCPLTSNPYKTVLMFSILGGLFAKDKKANVAVIDKKNEQL